MRQSTLRSICLLALLGVLPAGADVDKPNIIYVLTDDLGYGDVQCLNPRRCKIPTPHIDRFAEQGMTFTDAHSGSSVCTPTRYGVMTGRYSWRTKLQSGIVRFDNSLIAKDRKTVAALLREQGYHTAGIGKWHLGCKYQLPGSDIASTKHTEHLPIGTRLVEGPVERGFDQFYSMVQFEKTDWAMFEDGELVENLRADAILPRLTERGVAYIKEKAKSNQPFFLYWAPPVPHTPLAPSTEWRGKSPVGIYGDFVMQLDHTFGQLVKAVDESGIADNTLIIFTSDNGAAAYVGVKGMEKGHFPSAQYRGYKMDIWEGGHRVPFFVRWPGKIQAGAKTDQLTCLTDLMATVAELTGAKGADNLGEDSVSILPTLLKQEPINRGPVVHHSIEGKFAIRDGKWKLIFCAGSGGWTPPRDSEAAKANLPPIQLYDLEADASEANNLQTEQPEVVSRLTKKMKLIIENGRSTDGPPARNDVRVAFK